MTVTIRLAGTALALSLSATALHAACAFDNEVELRSLSGSFEAWKSVTDAMAECGNYTPELDEEYRTKQPAAFAADPALYHIGGVSNGTIVPLLNAGTIRPLDDLLEAHGDGLSPNQLVRIDGQVMAIAMMVNTQHFMYRSDIFEDLGLDAPETYADVLAAAEAIAEAGVVDYPIGATMASGWNLAQEFVNMFLGFGGSFLDETGQPTVNSDAGVAALMTMDALTAYMDPEFLVSDSTYVQQQFQQGRIAMANLWATRGAAMDDENESEVVGLVAGAAAPRAVGNGPPATTLWWDGMVIAANITDEEAEAAMRVIMEGLDQEMVTAHNDDAIWLVPGFVPGKLAQGAVATATAEPVTASYPSSSEMGLMHSALGNALPAFFTSDSDDAEARRAAAQSALAAAEAAYLTSAEEAGVLE